MIKVINNEIRSSVRLRDLKTGDVFLFRNRTTDEPWGPYVVLGFADAALKLSQMKVTGVSVRLITASFWTEDTGYSWFTLNDDTVLVERVDLEIKVMRRANG